MINEKIKMAEERVLNLIINGLPSKLYWVSLLLKSWIYVLNLIINGLPSKLKIKLLGGSDIFIQF